MISETKAEDWNGTDFKMGVSTRCSECSKWTLHLVCIVKTLRFLTHVGFLRQNGPILSEVFLYMERSKNQEKRCIITVQKNFTFLRRFDRKNAVLGISRNLIDKLVFK